MVPRVLLLIFCFFLLNYTSPGQVPIGNWREHLPYTQSIQVISAGGKIWSASPYSVFSIDPDDNSIERWSKVNGLNETGVQTIAADDQSEKIIVGYSNSSIDLLDEKEVIAINGLRNSSVTGDKKINHIFTRKGKAYIATGLGIVVADLEKHEIKDTYIIGHTGRKIRVYATTADNNYLYAATEEGLKKALLNASNLSDFRTWQAVTSATLTPGAVHNIASSGDRVIIQKKDSVFISLGNDWRLLYASSSSVNNLNIVDGKLAVNETGRITILTLDGIVDKIIQDQRFLIAPKAVVYFKNNYWIADTIKGLSKFDGSAFESYAPNSPAGVASGEMAFLNGTLWVAPGGVTRNWQPLGNKKGLYRFANNEWLNISSDITKQLDSLPDFVSLAFDPVNGSIWTGSYGGGLLNLRTDQSLTIYKQHSPLQPATASQSYRVTGLAFDDDQNLWIGNDGASKNLIVRKRDGTWNQFTVPFSHSQRVSQIVVDNENQKWIVAPDGNGLLCFNHGQSIENPADDKWKWYRVGQGQGNLPHNNVLSISKDKNGFIWVGTMQGIGIIQCPQEVFTVQGCDATIPVVQQDNFAGFLFRDQQVQSFAVDGADRKWVGTRNGVWLISADGQKIIHRFSADNSPLLSDDVNRIAIDHQTGEVFFSTAMGICSFRGSATAGNSSNTDVLVFPNPVPPGYTGTIAIRGLVNNALVKITELDGRMVYQTRALGGQAIWNGKDYKGRQISTGVYLVLVSDDTRTEKMVTKIVFINK